MHVSSSLGAVDWVQCGHPSPLIPTSKARRHRHCVCIWHDGSHRKRNSIVAVKMAVRGRESLTSLFKFAGFAGFAVFSLPSENR
jgi:hypothetical protein